MSRQKKESANLKINQLRFSSLRKINKKDWRIMNRASGNWDNIKTSNICVFAGFPGRQKKEICVCRKKSIWWNNGYTLLKFVERHNFVNSRSSANPKWVHSSKIMPWYIIVKLLKTKDKEKVLKATMEKQHLTYRRKVIRMTMDF